MNGIKLVVSSTEEVMFLAKREATTFLALAVERFSRVVGRPIPPAKQYIQQIGIHS